eukprot:TRINITY_DN4528_c0_g1_i2.p1 TRINITY_DN4528_c0_g1~~TRINITY_DN4528_c0_g1_i2.p1  ORF type:complete len:3672 (+),score=603.72 TRINITY_DN4528_c0_g1_i2:2537-13552(+)
MSKAEAGAADPQQRLLLLLSQEALDDAGEDCALLRGTRTAVVVGLGNNDWNALARGGAVPDACAHSATGAAVCVAANRVSYTYDFRGPSLVVETACSSSLVAVDIACQMFRGGSCERAIIGGANLILTSSAHSALALVGFLSPDGECRPFDAKARGYVRSEGVAAVVLKPLRAATAARDRIYAVVRATSVNHCGQSNGLTAPNPAAQQALLREAYERAGISPSAACYVECHAAGTALGDPIEAQALAAVFGAGRAAAEPLLLGSVKSNIGHTEGCAGLAGLIKLALSLHHGVIPPTINLGTPNPAISFGAALEPVLKQTGWRLTSAGEAVGGVSSFGFGGSNCHAVLSRLPQTGGDGDESKSCAAAHTTTISLLALSASSVESLKTTAIRFARRLQSAGSASQLICDNSLSRWTHCRQHRAMFTAKCAQELVYSLQAWASDAQPLAKWDFSCGTCTVSHGVCYVMSGQGGSCDIAGALATVPWLRRRCAQVVKSFDGLVDFDVLQELQGAPDSRANDQLRTQVCLFVFQLCAAELWENLLGVRCAGVIGHSAGEIAAACFAGALDVCDAAHLVVERAKLMQDACAPRNGGMCFVSARPEDLRPFLARHSAVSVACINSPFSAVLSGHEDTLRACVADIYGAHPAWQTQHLSVQGAFHSARLDFAVPLLRERLSGSLVPRYGRVPFYSTSLGGQAVSGADLTADYWAKQLRNTVMFSAAVTSAAKDGLLHFVEIGDSLAQHVSATLSDCNLATVVRTLAQGETATKSIAHAAMTLWVTGVDIRAAGLKQVASDNSTAFERVWHAEMPLRVWNLQSCNEVVSPARHRLECCIYEQRWEESSAAPSNKPSGPAPQILLFTSGSSATTLLRSALAKCCDVVSVQFGTEFSRTSDQECSASPSDAATVLEHYKGLFSSIVYAWADCAPNAERPWEPAVTGFVSLMQALARAQVPALPIVVVTNNAIATQHNGDEDIHPAQAALAACALSLRDEYPHFGELLAVIDISSVADTDALAQEVLLQADRRTALQEHTTSTIVAVHRGARLSSSLCVVDAPPASTWDCLPLAGGTFLITGGFGAVGLELARWLAGCAAQRIVLLGRNPPSLQAKAAIAHLQSKCHVQEVVAHVEDACALETLMAELKDLTGVFHTAGIASALTFGQATPAAIAEAVQAKILGAVWLDRLTRVNCPRLRYFVLFSSLASLRPRLGQGLYAAGNAYLNALADRRLREGQPALCVCPGLIGDAGMVHKRGVGLEEILRQMGVLPMKVEEVVRATVFLLGRAKGASAVYIVSRSRHHLSDEVDSPEPDGTCRAAPFCRNRKCAASGKPARVWCPTCNTRLCADCASFHADLFAAHVVTNVSFQGAPVPTPSPLMARSRGEIREWLVRNLTEELQTGAKIEDDMPLSQYGLKSVSVVAICARLGTWLGKPRGIPVNLFYDFPTVAVLAEALSSQQEQRLDGQAQHKYLQTRPHSEPLAIVGMACRWPGSCTSPEGFWELLTQARDAMGKPSKQRMAFLGEEAASIEGGWLDDVCTFDADFWGISAREAERLDPQQRLCLELAWEALEDAGCVPARIAGGKHGVFIGVTSAEYGLLQALRGDFDDPYVGTGEALGFNANRVSYQLNLTGPSIVVDTACSSGAVALHQACTAIRSGECDTALVGGVNVIAADCGFCSLPTGALSPSGRCYAFDSRADGYVRAEGAGMFLLKLLSHAREDNDRVYCTVLGSAVGHGGKTQGMTAPCGIAQQRVVKDAFTAAGASLCDAAFFECHGTGTQLGDPIEVVNLGKLLLQHGRTLDAPAYIGSVKSNIGHSEAAAGIAAVMKVALAFRKCFLPPSINFESPNPHIDFASLPLRVCNQGVSLSESSVGGVSSFGMGGTIAHVVLHSEYHELCRSPADSTLPAEAVLLGTSAKTTHALQDALRTLADFVENTKSSLLDVSYSLLCRRQHHKHRAGVCATSSTDACRQLRELAENPPTAAARPPAIIFEFGQLAAPTLVRAASQLYASSAVFRFHFDELRPLLGLPAEGFFEDCEQYSFAFLLCVARLLADLGVTPAAIISGGGTCTAAACCLEKVPLKQAKSSNSDSGTTVSGFQCFLRDGPAEPFCRASRADVLKFVAEKLGSDAVFLYIQSCADKDANAVFLSYLAELYRRGCDIKWDGVFENTTCKPRFVPTPTYPWQKKAHWLRKRDDRTREATTSAPLAVRGRILAKGGKHERQESILQYLRQSVARALSLTEKDVDATRSPVAIGFDSILASELRSKICENVGVTLPISMLVSSSFSVQKLAAEIEERLRTQKTALSGTAINASECDVQWYPVSGEQEQMLMLSLSSPSGTSAYSTSMYFLLRGPMNVPALRSALHALVVRHDVLRTSFKSQPGEPPFVQRVNAPPDPTHLLREVDCRGKSLLEARQMLRALAEEKPFDLFDGTAPVRILLGSLTPTNHILGLVLHHVLYDGFSFNQIAREVPLLYEKADVQLPPVMRYTEYAVRQRVWLHESPEAARQLNFWSRTLTGDLPSLSLFEDKQRPSAPTSRGAFVPVRLSAAVLSGLKELARSRSYTLFSVALALYQLLLCRLTRQDEVVVGVPFHGRTTPEMECAVGYFVKVLPVRTQVHCEEALGCFMHRVHEMVTTCLDNADVPLPAIVKALGPGSCPQLFQTTFTLQSFAGGSVSLAGLESELLPQDQFTCMFDLSLDLSEQDNQLVGRLEYDTDVFDHSTVAWFAAAFEVLAASTGSAGSLDERVDRIPMLDAATRKLVLEDWSGVRSVARPPDAFQSAPLLDELFSSCAEETPNATAVIFSGADKWTYRQVRDLSDAFAGTLRAAGVTRGDVVGVCTGHRPEYVWCALGVLKAGAAFLPLLPSYPSHLMESLLSLARVKVVAVSESDPPSVLPEGVCTLPAPLCVAAGTHSLDGCCAEGRAQSDAAYVISTSGSTGTPKLVTISHASAVGVVTTWGALWFSPSSRVLLMSPTVFDQAVGDVFFSLSRGAALVIPPADSHLADVDELHHTLSAEQVTHVFMVPTLLAQYCAYHELPPTVEHLDLGGEEVRWEVLASLRHPYPQRLRVLNSYGPAECTINSTFYAVPWQRAHANVDGGGRSVPIGQPLPRTHCCFVMDNAMRPVPPGFPGELYIGGPGLALGYLNQPKETAARFVFVDELPQAGRLYRTGDLARWTDDGKLVFLGRADFQVKIHGQRIELGAVEAAARAAKAVEDAVALVVRERIVCFIVTPDDSAASDAIRTCSDRLPAQMIPARVVTLRSWPRTHSGKVDRKTLKALAESSASSSKAAPMMIGSMPRMLMRLWVKVLGDAAMEGASLDANFFACGGHSLLAVSLAREVSRYFAVRFTTSDVMRFPVLSDMAAHLSMLMVHDRTSARTITEAFSSADNSRPFVLCFCGALTIELPFVVLKEAIGDAAMVHIVQYPPGAKTVKDTAAELVAELDGRDCRNLILVAFCAGGVFAFECAKMLAARGTPCKALVLLDAPVEEAPLTREQNFFLLGYYRYFAVGQPRMNLRMLASRLQVQPPPLERPEGEPGDLLAEDWLGALHRIPMHDWAALLLESCGEPVASAPILHELFTQFLEVSEATEVYTVADAGCWDSAKDGTRVLIVRATKQVTPKQDQGLWFMQRLVYSPDKERAWEWHDILPTAEYLGVDETHFALCQHSLVIETVLSLLC